MMRKIFLILSGFLMAVLLATECCAALAEDKQLTILFTSDIHSYFVTSSAEVEGTYREHGGAGRLMTLVNGNRNDHTLILDAGDFAMGTLLQTGFTTDAYELRLMGRIGFDATTFGNHEFDLTCTGAAEMIQSAVASGDPLPMLLTPANLDLSGTLNANQRKLKDALDAAGSVRWVLKEVNGIRVAVFGLMGANAVKCAPTGGVVWKDAVQAAKDIVAEIGDQADVIVCVSHSGTGQDGKSGEDVDLLKKVSGIDVVISGHSHIALHESVSVHKGVLGAAGCFLSWLGRMDLTVSGNGTVRVDDYKLIPIDEKVASDAVMDDIIEECWEGINNGYLAGTGYRAQQVILRSDFALSDTPVREEMPLCDLIADSYLYACREAGLDDVEVAIVGHGTVRTAIHAGDTTVADAFEVCSLGEGKDGKPGHPLVSAWIYGRDLKLIAEMDAFVGGMMSTVLINYAGMNVTYDANRVPLDRVTGLEIVRSDGSTEPVVMDRLYRVTANMYAINMLSSISSMTRGIITLNPMDSQGNIIPSDGLYDFAVMDGATGREVKEWKAFCDYLSSFDKVDGVARMPERYRAAQGRKTITRGNLWEIIRNPGPTTLGVLGIIALVILLITAGCIGHRKRKLRKQAAGK